MHAHMVDAGIDVISNAEGRQSHAVSVGVPGNREP
jgi:hypothetical protein